MTTKAKSTNKGSAAAAEAAPEANAAEWAQQVVEHLVDAQKRWIDLTAQQNALVLKAIEEGMEFYRTAPTPALAGWDCHISMIEMVIPARKREWGWPERARAVTQAGGRGRPPTTERAQFTLSP